MISAVRHFLSRSQFSTSLVASPAAAPPVSVSISVHFFTRGVAPGTSDSVSRLRTNSTRALLRARPPPATTVSGHGCGSVDCHQAFTRLQASSALVPSSSDCSVAHCGSEVRAKKQKL